MNGTGCTKIFLLLKHYVVTKYREIMLKACGRTSNFTETAREAYGLLTWEDPLLNSLLNKRSPEDLFCVPQKVKSYKPGQSV